MGGVKFWEWALTFGDGAQQYLGRALKIGQITPPKNGRGIMGAVFWALSSTSSRAGCRGAWGYSGEFGALLKPFKFQKDKRGNIEIWETIDRKRVFTSSNFGTRDPLAGVPGNGVLIGLAGGAPLYHIINHGSKIFTSLPRLDEFESITIAN